MPRNVSVVFRKENIPGALPPLRGRAAVVIDVLRASSTMVAALGYGAANMLLAATPDEARTIAAGLPPGSFLLGGERGGRKIDGFDLGNSPREYTEARVADKTIVFTTTNGTEALRACAREGAASIWVGALLNVEVLTETLLELHEDIVLVCAGTDGVQCAEDAYCAGALMEALEGHAAFERDDSAWIAINHFRGAGSALSVLKASRGGRNLIDIGLEQDIEDCTDAEGQFDVAPWYDPENNRVS